MKFARPATVRSVAFTRQPATAEASGCSECARRIASHQPARGTAWSSPIATMAPLAARTATDRNRRRFVSLTAIHRTGSVERTCSPLPSTTTISPPTASTCSASGRSPSRSERPCRAGTTTDSDGLFTTRGCCRALPSDPQRGREEACDMHRHTLEHRASRARCAHPSRPGAPARAVRAGGGGAGHQRPH